MKPIDLSKLNTALHLLNEQLILRDSPSIEELTAAARWCMTQDVSETFRNILLDMFNKLGWPDVCKHI